MSPSRSGFSTLAEMAYVVLSNWYEQVYAEMPDDAKAAVDGIVTSADAAAELPDAAGSSAVRRVTRMRFTCAMSASA